MVVIKCSSENMMLLHKAIPSSSSTHEVDTAKNNDIMLKNLFTKTINCFTEFISTLWHVIFLKAVLSHWSRITWCWLFKLPLLQNVG